MTLNFILSHSYCFLHISAFYFETEKTICGKSVPETSENSNTSVLVGAFFADLNGCITF